MNSSHPEIRTLSLSAIIEIYRRSFALGAKNYGLLIGFTFISMLLAMALSWIFKYEFLSSLVSTILVSYGTDFLVQAILKRNRSEIMYTKIFRAMISEKFIRQTFVLSLIIVFSEWLGYGFAKPEAALTFFGIEITPDVFLALLRLKSFPSAYLLTFLSTLFMFKLHQLVLYRGEPIGKAIKLSARAAIKNIWYVLCICIFPAFVLWFAVYLTTIDLKDSSNGNLAIVFSLQMVAMIFIAPFFEAVGYLAYREIFRYDSPEVDLLSRYTSEGSANPEQMPQ